MKNLVKYILQKLLGFENYLFFFSVFKINTLSLDRKENDFLFFLKTIDRDGYILDIGANIGIMTSHFSRKFPKSTIISYEPIPQNINTLKKIIQFFDHPNVIIKETALGNKSGFVTMVMPTNQNVKMQGLSHVVDISSSIDGEIFQVPISSADNTEELKERSKPVTAIKIDVENYEFHVLKGCENIITRDFPVIYLELWNNKNRQNCFNLLNVWGYKPMVVRNNAMMNFDKNQIKTQNFIFLPNNRHIQ